VCLTGKDYIIEFYKHSGTVNTKFKLISLFMLFFVFHLAISFA